MTIIFRAEKGSPLTSQEIDGNFKELEDRLKTVEEQTDKAESLGKISLDGNQLHFLGTFGTDFGTFPLPQATFNPRGIWEAGIPYKRQDIVAKDNALYSCREDHKGAEWEQDQFFWKLILTLPQPPPSSLAVYEKASLPEKEALGRLALLLEGEGMSLIFFTGKNWQQLKSKGENL